MKFEEWWQQQGKFISKKEVAEVAWFVAKLETSKRCKEIVHQRILAIHPIESIIEKIEEEFGV